MNNTVQSTNGICLCDIEKKKRIQGVPVKLEKST